MLFGARVLEHHPLHELAGQGLVGGPLEHGAPEEVGEPVAALLEILEPTALRTVVVLYGVAAVALVVASHRSRLSPA